jgi:hypothetical protein
MLQSFIRPRPIGLCEIMGRDLFPQNRVAYRTDTELGNEIEVIQAGGMTGTLALIEVFISNTIVGTLNATP